MARLRRKTLDRTGWTETHIQQLLGGHGWHPPGFDVDLAREAWSELRGELLPEWIREYPCSRPCAWWAFDSLERRRCTTGIHEFDRPEWRGERIADGESPEPGPFDLSWGSPRYTWIDPLTNTWPEYEKEVNYLHRLGLLLSFEEKLYKSGWRPPGIHD